MSITHPNHSPHVCGSGAIVPSKITERQAAGEELCRMIDNMSPRVKCPMCKRKVLNDPTGEFAPMIQRDAHNLFCNNDDCPYHNRGGSNAMQYRDLDKARTTTDVVAGEAHYG